jgi:hypothetical protein
MGTAIAAAAAAGAALVWYVCRRQTGKQTSHSGQGEPGYAHKVAAATVVDLEKGYGTGGARASHKDTAVDAHAVNQNKAHQAPGRVARLV